jgi:hypothetical protein
MIFAIDHIVFAATVAQRDAIGAQLEAAGCGREAFTLDFPDDGVGSESWSTRSGAFLEFVAEHEGRRGPAVWFDAAPRIIGLGFASDAFAADTGWPQETAWRMDEAHVLPDGTPLRIHAAGPHRHLSDFYVFVMDRPDGALEFGERTAAPRITRIVLHGDDAGRYLADLAGWFGTTLQGGVLTVGDCELAVGTGGHPGVRASLDLEGAAPLRLDLSTGRIEVHAA